MKLSVVIITKNEEHNIGRCLDSAAWADEVVVLDSGSDDNTVAICRDRGCVVHTDSDWRGFGMAKQKAAGFASNDWILSLDADEVLCGDLRDEVRNLLSAGPAFNAYRIRRISHYLGKRIRHSGWNRDFPVRLFNRKHAGFTDDTVHEFVRVDGRIGSLGSPMEHFPYPTLDVHLAKMRSYAELGSIAMHARGRRSCPFSALFRGKAKFLKMYILQFGFLDGLAGLTLAVNSAWGVYLKYIRLWELNR